MGWLDRNNCLVGEIIFKKSYTIARKEQDLGCRGSDHLEKTRSANDWCQSSTKYGSSCGDIPVTGGGYYQSYGNNWVANCQLGRFRRFDIDWSGNVLKDDSLGLMLIWLRQILYILGGSRHADLQGAHI